MEDRDSLRAASRPIHGHGTRTAGEILGEVARWCQEHEVALDDYGSGELIESFEAQVAEHLGYEAGRFMPSGTLAQQVAMRIWSERAGVDLIGMHPTSHLELHEERGYSYLHGLTAVLVGPVDRPLLAEHLEAVPQRLGALLTELPVREAGGLLPTWDQLDELKQAGARSGLPLHLDGARLWECGPAYGRALEEICAGFASTYVSFYKGIGALPGAMLLGSSDFVAEAAVWQRRGGGNLHTLTPSVASAAMVWREQMGRMPAYLERARAMTEVMREIDGLTPIPDPPHVNMMHLVVELDMESAAEARDRVARETGLWMFGSTRPADVPGHVRTEIYVGEAAMAVDDAELARALEMLMSAPR